MPTRNVNLTPQMDRLVETKIRNGQYANASEVIRAGLRALEEGEREDAAKIDALREAINAGEASGLAKGDLIGRLRMRIHSDLVASYKENGREKLAVATQYTACVCFDRFPCAEEVNGAEPHALFQTTAISFWRKPRPEENHLLARSSRIASFQR